jgi:uncharacterized protein YndB with AHSA1/START domain
MPLNETQFTKDLTNKMVLVTRRFNAPVELVWKYWTQKEHLDQWWAPQPFKARTRSMDFREGGTWLYCMEGPSGERHWARADYETIIPGQRFTCMDAFCDENGGLTTYAPRMHWDVTFIPEADGTLVTTQLTFNSEAELGKIMAMGFKEGFTAAHTNLDTLLAK